MTLNNRTFLIMGGMGFIGGALAEALVVAGARVRSFDDESRGARSRLGQVAADVESIVGSPPAEQPAYPPHLILCRNCQLVELGLVVDPAILFPPTYPYTSGTTKILRENFAELSQEVDSLFSIAADDLVVDIGSNDGTLLSNFVGRLRVHGIEPTNAGLLARERGIPTLISFFNRGAVREVIGQKSKDIKASGARIYGIGASRASTLINYVGLDDGILDCVLEINGSYKIGKYIPGTLIPVAEEGKLFDDQPEYALLLSWHIADEIMPKLRARGFRGKFLIPLPEPRVVAA